MVSRETPPSEDDIYDVRGQVPLSRPITQGDVFRDVGIPGFDESFPAVIVTQHPCSMRTGAKLRPRLMVAAVRPRATITCRDWQGNASAMLLPKLLDDGKDYQADFRDSGSVKTTELARTNRIAALTNYGVQILHQRSIYYHTRFTVDIATLAETFEAIAAELELQYDWVEASLGAISTDDNESGILAAINGAEEEFGNYLDANNRALRSGLQDALSRADVRRQVRREIAKRFGDSGSLVGRLS